MKMVLEVATYKQLVFFAGDKENPVLRVYSARPVCFVIHRDDLPCALVNNIIAYQSYAYYTDYNYPVIYSSDCRAFVAGDSGVDIDRGAGDGDEKDGHDCEKRIVVEIVPRIVIPEKCLRKKSRTHTRMTSLSISAE